MKKYNHAFTVAFTVVTTNEADKVTEKELLAGLTRRLADLIEHDEIIEAVGMPYDTYEMEE